MKMSIKLVLKNVLLALGKIHVLGAEAGLLDGAMKNIDAVIETLEKLEKEEAENANRSEKREDV